MSLRDRNGHVYDFDIEDLGLYREALDELEAHFPGSRAATDTRRLLTLIDAAERIGESQDLIKVWAGISHDLNNNVYELDHSAKHAVEAYEALDHEPVADHTALFAAVEEAQMVLRRALRALELSRVEDNHGR